MRIKNLPSIESMDGSQDALVIEQTDGSEDKSRKVSPAQIKQYVLGNSIDDIYSVMGQNGAKNLIPYPYNETTQVDHGVTFTINNDGTVIANGTANGTAQFYLVLGNVSLSDPGNLVINTNEPLFLSGCPSGGSHSTFRIQYGLTDGTTYWAKTASDIGNGVEITPVDGLNSYCFDVIKIMVFDGYTVNNLTFKPMLRLASDTDNTYQPYAKTNKQLTETIGDLTQTGLTGDSVAAQLGTAKVQISGITTGQKNVWFPDVYDYTTKIKTLTSSDCTTYVQKIGDLTIAWVYSLSASSWGNFSLMAQFRNFPNGTNWCLGGIVFNKNLQIQSSNIGVYFRPNLVGTFDDMFSVVLFFAKMS